jgi:hypothetical protein
MGPSLPERPLSQSINWTENRPAGHKGHYEIPAGTAAVGALLYARHGKEIQPIVVNVKVGDEQFTFRSEYR